MEKKTEKMKKKMEKKMKKKMAKMKKKKMEEEESSASSAGKNTLPSDVLLEILLRLPAKSVWRFRMVCKSWNSLATDPSFVRLHTRRHCNEAAGPKSMLICYNTEGPKLSLCIVGANVDNNQIFHRHIKIPVKPDYAMYTSELYLRLSCDGLLCFVSPQRPKLYYIYEPLTNRPKIYYICNPVTKAWTTVAAVSPRTVLRGFYFHPSTGEYRLLQYFYKCLSAQFESAGYEVATVNPRGNNTSWRRVYELCRLPVRSCFAHDSARTLDQLLARSPPWEAPITVDGNLHWLPGNSNIVGVIVFDTSSEKFSSIPLPFYVEQGTLTPTLLEIGGNLCIGCPMRSPQDMEIWLLKDHKNQQWVPTHTIISDQVISRTPSEDADEEGAGSLLKRYNGSLFSLYDLKHKTCCRISIPRLSYSQHCVDYTESLVMV